MLAVMLLFDIRYLISKLLRGLEFFTPIPNEHLWLYHTIANTSTIFSLTASILMMVTIGRIRYQAVQKPHHPTVVPSSSKQIIWMLLKYPIQVMVLSFSFSFTAPIEIDEASGPLRANHSILLASILRPITLYCLIVLGMMTFTLLGLVPFVCLIYFWFKIVLHINKRRRKNTDAPHVIRMMNENIESIVTSVG